MAKNLRGNYTWGPEQESKPQIKVCYAQQKSHFPLWGSIEYSKKLSFNAFKGF